jgi:hypothetical protein
VGDDMKWFLGVVILSTLLTACTHDKPLIEPAHWGDRSSWRDNNWEQDFYADSDGHLVGKISGIGNYISATCTLIPFDLGEFEFDIDAQIAVEQQCYVTQEERNEVNDN